MRLRVILYLGVFVCCSLLSMRAYGENTEACLGCHGDKDLVQMGGKEMRSLYVDQAELRVSVHGSFGCSDCHQDISLKSHPNGKYSGSHGRSNICKNCHTDFQGIHASLVGGKTAGPACTECHGANHAIKHVEFTRESESCLGCHGKEMHLVLGDGTELSLKVDRTHIGSSVHSTLTCSDCHSGFSSKEHPKKTFASRRSFDIASAENCRNCHDDKYTKTHESIHFVLRAQGNLDTPVCTDCHGSHSIQKGQTGRLLSAKRCGGCHAKIFSAYAASVHGRALINENNQDVPVCVDCHKAHDISNPLTMEFHKRVPEICGKCHADNKRMGRYGVSSTVVKTYYKGDFHGITLGLFKQKGGARRPAVCTDCHGIHDIAGMDQPNSPKNKTYLVRKCVVCHRDAPAGFSDSSIAHYEASFAMAPTIFAINMFYRIFTGLMVTGLFVQIGLHLRHIVFKHKKE